MRRTTARRGRRLAARAAVARRIACARPADPRRSPRPRRPSRTSTPRSREATGTGNAAGAVRRRGRRLARRAGARSARLRRAGHRDHARRPLRLRHPLGGHRRRRDRPLRARRGRAHGAGRLDRDELADPRGHPRQPAGHARRSTRIGLRAVQSRPIGADGALGAAANTTVAGTLRFLAMTLSRHEPLRRGSASRAARAAVSTSTPRPRRWRRRPRPPWRGRSPRASRRPTARPRG